MPADASWRDCLTPPPQHSRPGSLAVWLAGEIDETEDEVVVPDEEQARERATAGLASVAASQRAALVLCYVDVFSVREAAGILGKGEEAVESLLARGRASFKRAYMEAGT